MSGIPVNATDWAAADGSLHDAIGRARGAWRRRVLLEGAAWTVAALLVLLVVLALVGAAIGLTPERLVILRLVFYVLLLVALGWWIVRPALRRVDDARLALYLEERDPGLGQALMSAVQAIGVPVAERPSPGLARRLAAQAVGALGSLEDGRALERPRVRRAGMLLAGLAALAAIALLVGPESWRTTMRGLLAPWRPAEAIVAPRSVAVEPGNITVPRGATLDIHVATLGFAPPDALLYLQRQGEAEWTSVPMPADSTGHFTLRLFDLDSTTTYRVEAGELRSPSYVITVTDLPAVSQLALALDYPTYTGLPDDSLDAGGDVAAVIGTVVEVHATVTMPVRGAMLRFDDGRRIPLTLDATGRPTGRFRIGKSGFYTIDLVAPDGTEVPGSVRWAIDALPDRPPVVRVLDPGRDTRATNVEEVPLAIGADDDYGMRALELHFSVNGGAEQSVIVGQDYAAGTLTPRGVHTLYLEEYNLKAGDLVSYYATGIDGAGNRAKSDLYFIEIRPFSRNYRQSEQGGGGGGGGGGGNQDNPQFSREQKELMVAAYNIQRDSATTPPERFREDLATVAVGQENLRDEVQRIAGQLEQRGAAQVDSDFVAIKASLDSAAAKMDTVLTQLRGARLGEAVSSQARALQQVQRSEALYRDVELQINQGGGGGGGGGGGAAPEDLADLFELETDKLRNQYEAVQRQGAAESQVAQQVDSARERLRDLARRAEQENERQQRMADDLQRKLAQQSGAQQAGGGGGGGGATGGAQGGGQSSAGNQGAAGNAAARRLAEEAEAEARRLERLAREQRTPELAQAAQMARQAADQLRRAANGQAGQAGSAAESLRNAAAGVASGQESAAREATERLAGRAGELARDQQEFTRDAGNLPPSGDARRNAATQALEQRSQQMERDARGLVDDLDRASRDVNPTDPRAASAIREAAARMREAQVPERIGYAGRIAGDQRINAQMLRQFNTETEAILNDVRNRLAVAAGGVGASPERQQQQAMERARELVRGLESLRDRTAAGLAGDSARAAGNGEGQPGQGQQPGRGQQPGQGEGQGQAQGRGQQPGQGQGQPGQAGGEGQGQGQGDRNGQGQAGGQGERGGQGGGNRAGDPQGAPGGAPGGEYTGGGDARQLRGEVQVRLRDARALRDAVREQGLPTTDLDQGIRYLEQLQQDRVTGDPKNLVALQDAALEALKRAEFDLWLRVGGGEGGRPAVGDASRVPPRYRQMVEEYYKAIARDRP